MTHHTPADFGEKLVNGASIAAAIAIFGLPFIIAPWVSDPLEINKFVWVTGWTLLATCCLAVQIFLGKKLVLPTPLALLGFGIWIAALTLSAVGSWNVSGSFLGFSSQEYASVITAIVYFLLFGVITIGAKTAGGRQYMIWALVSSGLLLSGVATASVLGLNTGLQGLPSGTPTATGLVLVLLHIFCLALVGLQKTPFAPVLNERGRQVMEGVSVVSFAIAIPYYLAVDAVAIWLVMLLGAGVILVLGFYGGSVKQAPIRFVPLGLAILMSISLLIISPRLFSALPIEVGPNSRASFAITQQSWSDGRLLLGTGPGTFSLAFDKYHSVDLNQTDFWDARFDRAHSHLTTLLTTVGLLGVAAWVIFTVCIAFAHLHRGSDGSFPAVPALIAFLGASLAACLYPQTFTLATLMIVFAGLGTAFAPGSAKQKEMKDTAAVGAVALVGGSLAIVIVLFIALFTMSRYSSEIVYAKALARESEAAYDEAILLLDKAANRNRWNDTYYAALARVLLIKADVIARDPMSDPEVVQSLLASSINAATKATELAPMSAIRWAERGDLYRDIAGVVSDGAPFSLVSYEEASKHSPVNPKYQVGIGRAHLAIAESLREQSEAPGGELYITKRANALELADEAFTKALVLKADYVPALYFQAVTLDARGLVPEAIGAMEKVRSAAPTDIGVLLNLALLYMRQEQNDLAKIELEKALEIAPTFANAHWYLSILEEDAGNQVAAIKHIEQIIATDPLNAAAKQRLERLQEPVSQAGETVAQ